MKHIFLDLDQTCISAHETNEFDPNQYKEKMDVTPYGKFENYYYIFERPYLQMFLDHIFANFTVSICTAATKDYAIFIVDNMIIKKRPERKIKYLFHSYHCDISKKVLNSSKNLSMLWNVYDLQDVDQTNTCIIDDYDEVAKTQPYNCIVAPPYTFTDFNSQEDTFLLRITNYLKSKKFITDYDKYNTIQTCVKYMNEKLPKAVGRPRGPNKRDRPIEHVEPEKHVEHVEYVEHVEPEKQLVCEGCD